MRTNIVINNELMQKALETGKFKTKRQAVEEGLKLLIKMNAQSQLRKLRGAIPWEGNLNRMRRDKK